jgi:O-antigen/teichoic acid export membrane protein
VTRWTTSLVIPALLLILVFRGDLLRAISPSTAHDTLFVAILLIPPFTSCAFGLAGACLMFTGHTRATLANSLFVGLVNTALTVYLVPRHGMLGAAIATAIATSIMTGLQMIELERLERVAISWRAIWKPHVGLAVAVLPIVATWDPAALPPLQRIAVAVTSCGVYGAVLCLVRHDELMRLARRR